jgi:hypothetical protein
LEGAKRDLMFGEFAKPWMLTVLVLLLVMGCDRRETIPVSTETDSEAKSDFDGKAGGEEGAGVSSFSVSLLPEKPRAGDELRTEVRGAGGPFVFIWEKYGEPIAGRNKTRLSRLGLVRGDVIRVVVTAGKREASAETVIHNSPPEVLSVVGKSANLSRGVDFEVEPRAIDADGDPVEFGYTWLVNDRELIGEDGPVLSGDSFVRGDIVKLVVIPMDDEEEGEPFSQGLEFEVDNAPPRFVSMPTSTFTAEEYRYQVQAEDPDGDEISYKLDAGPEGMTIDPASGLVLWSISPEVSGTHEVKIEARDTEGLTAWQEFSLHIERGE